jgi:hypothetical protein
MPKRTPEAVGVEELKAALLAFILKQFGDRPLDN